MIVLRNGLVNRWPVGFELLLVVEAVRVANGGELETSGEVRRFDAALTLAFGANIEKEKLG